MAASDDLMKLAQRAKVAEDRVAAARTQARSDVERQAAKVRDTAQQKSEQLRSQTDKAATGAAQWWGDVQAAWSGHLAHIREEIESKKAGMDTKAAQRRADIAEDDAAIAVAFAESALEEAEYAVLNATITRMEAESPAR